MISLPIPELSTLIYLEEVKVSELMVMLSKDVKLPPLMILYYVKSPEELIIGTHVSKN